MTYKVVYDRETHTTRIEFDESIVTPIPVADWDSVRSALENHDTATLGKGFLATLMEDITLVLSLGMVIALGVTIAKLFM